jgi:hypothetical protein
MNDISLQLCQVGDWCQSETAQNCYILKSLEWDPSESSNPTFLHVREIWQFSREKVVLKVSLTRLLA